MENYIHQEVGLKLSEIINNINVGLYQHQNIDNIRIISKNKPNHIILCSEVDTIDNIKNFFISSNKKVNTFEETFYDFYVVTNDNQSQTLSLLEVIISSEFLVLEETEKWLLTDESFEVIEINYDTTKERDNIEFLKNNDMKIFG